MTMLTSFYRKSREVRIEMDRIVRDTEIQRAAVGGLYQAIVPSVCAHRSVAIHQGIRSLCREERSYWQHSQPVLGH